MLGKASIGFSYLVGSMTSKRQRDAIDSFVAGDMDPKQGNGAVVPQILVSSTYLTRKRMALCRSVKLT